MEPRFAPLVTEVAFALGDFVGVVGECVVDAAAVQVKVFTEVLFADARALDVPAGIAHAPRRIPLQRLILELRLCEPQHEVRLVALVRVLIHVVAHADFEVFLVVVVKDVVLFQLAGVKVDVAACVVGIAFLQQHGNHVDVVGDAVRCGLNHVGALDVELLAVREERIGVELRDFHDRLVLTARALEHLVLARVGVAGKMADVGDVHYALDVVALIAQRLFEHVLHNIGAQVADMREMIDRRAAGVHGHLVAKARHKRLFAVGERIIQNHGMTLLLLCSFFLLDKGEAVEIKLTAGEEHERD